MFIPQREIGMAHLKCTWAHCKDSLSDINGVIRPGIVHRIDKDTTGLLVVAKNNLAHLKSLRNKSKIIL